MAAPATPIPDPSTDKPSRPRRRIPLSLRMFVAMLAILGVGSVLWVGIPAYRQHLAIVEIERVKGTVLLTRPRGPQWLRGSIGNGWTKLLLDDVVSVNLADSEVTDSTLVYLTGLPHLERLWLNRTAVTDAGLIHLASLTGLQELGLQGTRMGDAGLAHLTGLTKLEILFVSQTKLTDAGLRHIQGFTRLQKLSLENTQVSDAGLAHLAVLSRLQRLYVGESKVTEAGLSELRSALPNVNIHR